MADTLLRQLSEQLISQFYATGAIGAPAPPLSGAGPFTGEEPWSWLVGAFDVVVVDGPAGVTDDSPGRMAPIATAAALVEHGTGVVFVDDTDRFVEQVQHPWCLLKLVRCRGFGVVLPRRHFKLSAWAAGRLRSLPRPHFGPFSVTRSTCAPLPGRCGEASLGVWSWAWELASGAVATRFRVASRSFSFCNQILHQRPVAPA